MADRPEPNDQRGKKAKIYTEDVKQQHVTHWDRDYLPLDEVRPPSSETECPKCHSPVAAEEQECSECGEPLDAAKE